MRARLVAVIKAACAAGENIYRQGPHCRLNNSPLRGFNHFHRRRAIFAGITAKHQRVQRPSRLVTSNRMTLRKTLAKTVRESATHSSAMSDLFCAEKGRKCASTCRTRFRPCNCPLHPVIPTNTGCVKVRSNFVSMTRLGVCWMNPRCSFTLCSTRRLQSGCKHVEPSWSRATGDGWFDTPRRVFI